MNKILFISADPILKKRNIEVLSENGFTISDSADHLDALLKIDKDNYDLIIIDDEFSDYDGHEICQKIRSHSDKPIILLGMMPDAEIWDRVEEIGFDLYMKKPVSPRELLARIKALKRRYPAETRQTIHKIAQEDSHSVTEKAAESEEKPLKTKKLEPAPELPKEYFSPSITSFNDTVTQEDENPQIHDVSLSTSPATLVEDKNNTINKNISFNNIEGEDFKNDSFDVWRDGRIIKLIETAVNGKIGDITPVIDQCSKNGYSYPQINSIIEGNDDDTSYVLDLLVKKNILLRKPFEKLTVDPEGSFHLMPIERCPHCDSDNLIRGQLVEHFNCGYVAMEQDFRVDHGYTCPKCHREMRLIGTDYRNVGIHYKCLNCDEVFNLPVIKWKNLTSRKIWNSEELKSMWVYSYVFSPDKKAWLEFQLKPKNQLIEFLKSRGYQVKEFAQMSGSSGAIHMLDILATRDDILTKINLGIGILVAPAGANEVTLEELFKYDTRAYDVGINYKVVIAIPRLNAEAVRFSQRQMITVIEARTLSSVVSQLRPGRPVSVNIMESGQAAYQPYNINLIHQNDAHVKRLLIKFLMNRDYEVTENPRVIGKSGAQHSFDIIARRDEKIIVPAIAIRIIVLNPNDEVGIDELSQFDAEAFDSGIRNKAFVGLPRISAQAMQFAVQQKIKTIQKDDLTKFILPSN